MPWITRSPTLVSKRVAMPWRSRLSAIALCIGAAGLLAMGIEFCIDGYLREHWQPTWSLVVLVVCVGLIIPLRIVRRVPSLREEVRRRFNL